MSYPSERKRMKPVLDVAVEKSNGEPDDAKVSPPVRRGG